MHGDSQVRPGESSGGEHEANLTRTLVRFSAVRRIGTNVANATSPSNVQQPPRIGDLSGKLLTTGTGNEIQPARRAVAIACSAVNNTLPWILAMKCLVSFSSRFRESRDGTVDRREKGDLKHFYREWADRRDGASPFWLLDFWASNPLNTQGKLSSTKLAGRLLFHG
jgi:hypothetical protein